MLDINNLWIAWEVRRCGRKTEDGFDAEEAGSLQDQIHWTLQRYLIRIEKETGNHHTNQKLHRFEQQVFSERLCLFGGNSRTCSESPSCFDLHLPNEVLLGWKGEADILRFHPSWLGKFTRKTQQKKWRRLVVIRRSGWLGSDSLRRAFLQI